MQDKKLTRDDLKAKSATTLTRRILLGSAAGILAGLGVWYYTVAGADKGPTYRTADIVRGDITVTVTANGTLNPMRTVSIGSELSGIVRKVNVDVNSTVRAGDVLIELDTANLKANANQARASLSSAKAALAQAEATQAEAEAKMRLSLIHI